MSRPLALEIRVLAHLRAPWFVGADLRRVFDLSGGGAFYRGPADDEQRKVDRTNLGQTKGGRPMCLISEGGLSALIMRSDKPEAVAFQEWVTREVLPAIRQTGGYRLQGVAPEAVAEGTVSAMPRCSGAVSPYVRSIQILDHETIRCKAG